MTTTPSLNSSFAASVPLSFLLLILPIIFIGAEPSLAFQSGFHTISSSSLTSPSIVLPKPTSSTTTTYLQRSPNKQNHKLPLLKMGSSFSSSTDSTTPEQELLTHSTKENFQQKSILLTGASRGLGRSIAHQLSKCSASLLILSGRDEAALNQVKEECLKIYQACQSNNEEIMKVETIVCDLADKHSVENLATLSLEIAKNHGRNSGVIDVLINNGGISSRSSFLETKLEVDEKLMQVNFFSGAALAKRLIPGMVERNKESGGRVIWISSVQGKVGTPYRTSYAASKFAVQGYCEALRSELASSNISVHVASPGYIRTNLSVSAVMGDGKAYSKMDDTTANGADPDEVAAIILNSVAAGQNDFVVAATISAKAALWLKFLVPSFLESMLVKRFEKAKVEAKKDD